MERTRRSLDPTRPSRIRAASGQNFDLVVVGGGIIGAAAAREAALRGYSVLLLEQRDYAFGTSSRSSKLLHGGLRYLEQGDVFLVREALLERRRMLEAAPHLTRAERSLFPIIPALTRPSWQIRLGLSLYDVLSKSWDFRLKNPLPPHSRLGKGSKEAKHLKALGLHFNDLFAYSDGQMEDTRLVIEHILDATELGAVTLNHAKLVNARRLRGGYVPKPRRLDASPQFSLDWRDELSGELHTAGARYLFLSCGPWLRGLADTMNLITAPPAVRFSRGIHLLFDVGLDLPPLTLPTGEPGRVYFVVPHFSPFGKATLVGTTDRPTANVEDDPQAAPEEIEELLALLRRDLPHSGLTASRMFRTFCGVRVLIPSGGQRAGLTSAVSRREHFHEEDGCLSLWGGKYTTARLIAERVLNRVDAYFGQHPGPSSAERVLPGGRGYSPELIQTIRHDFLRELTMTGTDHEAQLLRKTVDAALFRLGSRALLLKTEFGPLNFRSGCNCLAAEFRLAARTEQAATADDLVMRRLLLWAAPGELEAAFAEVEREL